MTLPHQAIAGALWPILSTMYEYLVDTDLKSLESYQPMLASKWEVSADGTAITYELRPNVPFHDGWGDVTAEDAKFSIELFAGRVQGINSLSTDTARLKQFVKAIETDGQYRFTVKIDGQFSDVFWYLSSYWSDPIVSKKHFTTLGEKGAADKPAGTGPFRFLEWQKGSSMKFKAVPNHWRLVPDFDQVSTLFVNEDATRLAMLLTGEADVVNLPPSLKADVDKRAGFRSVVGMLPTYHLIVNFGNMYLPTHENYDQAVPWVKPEVRQAMSMAIDRKAIVEHILGGSELARVSEHPAFAPDGGVWSKNWTTLPYDAQKAKQLLAQAGYSKGFEVTIDAIIQESVPAQVAVMQAIAGYWDAIGLKTTVRTPELAVVRDRYRKFAPNKVIFPLSTALRPTEPSILAASYMSTATASRFNSPELERLAKEALAARGVEARREAMIRAGNYMYDNNTTMGIAYINGWLALNRATVAEWKGRGFHAIENIAAIRAARR